MPHATSGAGPGMQLPHLPAPSHSRQGKRHLTDQIRRCGSARPSPQNTHSGRLHLNSACRGHHHRQLGCLRRLLVVHQPLLGCGPTTAPP